MSQPLKSLKKKTYQDSAKYFVRVMFTVKLTFDIEVIEIVWRSFGGGRRLKWFGSWEGGYLLCNDLFTISNVQNCDGDFPISRRGI